MLFVCRAKTKEAESARRKSAFTFDELMGGYSHPIGKTASVFRSSSNGTYENHFMDRPRGIAPHGLNVVSPSA
jgi:hypothetical protein